MGRHDAKRSRSRKRLAVCLVLVTGYMGAEVIGGLLSGSLALLADAGHMLADAGALALSLFAVWIAQRPPTPRRSYGYYRTEILAALVNGAALVAVSIFIFVEGWGRLGEPVAIDGPLMMVVAAGGLVVNVVSLALLSGSKAHSLNVRGAFLHVMSDTLGSLGAILAGAVIWAFDWRWADPVVSFLIAILVLRSAWTLLQESVAVLMEHAPAHIEVDEVRDAVVALDGVVDVHDLHLWTITSGIVAVSAHVVEDQRRGHDLLAEIREALHDRFGIEHVTIQLEPVDFVEREAPF